MKKKLFCYMVIFMMLFQLSFSSVQAATPVTSSPLVCGAPSPEMLQYQRFQSEMTTKLLGGNFGETLFKADWQIVGLFTSKTLQIPKSENQAVDAILSSVWNSIRRLGQSSLTTFALLSLASVSVVTSNLEGLAILYQDRPIVREWRSVLQIESRIMQVTYFLGKTVNLFQPIKDMSGLRTIVLKYQDEGLFTWFVDKEGVSYLQIFYDLARMNAGMKYFISVGTTQPLELYNYTSLFGVSFSPVALQAMKEYYQPVRLVKGASVCNPTFKKLGSSIKQSFSSNVSAAKEAWTIIMDANKRLIDALAHSVGISTPRDKDKTLAEQYFTEYELQQLRTIYGIDTTKMTSRDAVNLKNLLQVGTNVKKSMRNAAKKAKTLFDSAKNTGKEIWWAGVGFFNWVKNFFTVYNESKQRYQNEKNTQRLWASSASSEDEKLTPSIFWGVSLSNEERKLFFTSMGSMYNEFFSDKLHEAFSASYADALDLYASTSQKFVSTNVSLISPSFYPLVAQVKSTWGVIGEPNIAGTIRRNVWTVCQRQCTDRGVQWCW